MNHLPFYIPSVFILTVITALFIFFKASRWNPILMMAIAVWMILQSVLGGRGFFTVTDSFPPRLLLLLLPSFAGVAAVMLTPAGRKLADRFDAAGLTALHTIRIGIELVLFWLFLAKAMPRLMTVEGRNFDLLCGITAPFFYYFGFVRRKIGLRTLLAWNLTCVLILAFTVTNAVLSAPGPFQQFGWEQPSIAVLYFPFVWLPGVVVPLVFLSHFITIRWLVRRIRERQMPAHASLNDPLAPKTSLAPVHHR